LAAVRPLPAVTPDQIHKLIDGYRRGLALDEFGTIYTTAYEPEHHKQLQEADNYHPMAHNVCY
jgi:hypothetical protein